MPDDQIIYTTDLTAVDWAALKGALRADAFDNGRSPAEYAQSFQSSQLACLAYAGPQIVGTARALSDGICDAYIVDVWTRSAYRRRGIASAMLRAPRYSTTPAWARMCGRSRCSRSTSGTVRSHS